MSLRVDLYERDGTFLKTLPTVEGITIRASRDTEVRRSASFRVPVSELTHLRRLGRRCKVVYAGQTLFSGYVDTVHAEVGAEGWVEVTARDKARLFKRARFAGDVTYEDAATVDATRSYTATASSEMAVGDEIQAQGRFYGRKLEATVFGITEEVTPTSETGDPTDGDYAVDYTADGLTGLKLTFGVDLFGQDTIQSITTTTSGSVESLQISTDGQSFVTFANGATGRYLRWVITQAAGPITVGVVIKTAVARPASNVTTDNAAAWQPRAPDLERSLTLSFSSAQVNGLRLRTGISDLDRDVAYRIKVEALVSGTWTEVIADGLVLAGLNDLAFTTQTATGLRITFKRANGQVAVRYAEVVYVSSTVTLDQIIKNILTTEGESDFSQIQAIRRLPPDKAVTFEAGTEKLRAILDLAESVGWEFFYDSQDRPVFRPRRWSDPMADDLLTYETLLEWQPRYDDAQVYNVVLAMHESGLKALTAKAVNDNGASATSTVHLGTLTSPILRNPWADTQQKLDLWAQEKLAEFSRLALSGSATVPWDETSIPEPGQYVRIIEPTTGTDETLVVDTVTLTEQGNALDLQLEFGGGRSTELAANLRRLVKGAEQPEPPRVETATVNTVTTHPDTGQTMVKVVRPGQTTVTRAIPVASGVTVSAGQRVVVQTVGGGRDINSGAVVEVLPV